MSECKQCGDMCEIRVSKSQKNPGKEFWSCSKGCKVWNGWVNDTKTSSSSDNAQKCKSCSADCTQRESKTPKNFGKKFWGCTKGCKIWNGWVSVETNSKSPKPKKPEGKRKATEEIKQEKSPKKPMISYHCAKCDKTLDLEHEIQNNIERYSKSLDYPKELIYVNLKTELTEGITSGDYTCEACLGNE